MILKFQRVLFILLVANSLIGSAQPKDSLSNQFLSYIQADDYEGAVSLFSDPLKANLPADELRTIFARYIRINGDMHIRDKVINTFYNSNDIVYRFLWFGNKGFRLYFTKVNDEISSLYLMPENTTNQYSLPDYVHFDNFNLQHILIESENYGLSGELICPKSANDFPIVIFIHGSGPSDRDQGMAGNRPFLDMAYGLANYGIGSLRFDKASYLFGRFIAEDKTYTVWDELGVDVTNIITYLADIEGIESDRVFLLGHSLGANQIPRLLDSLDVAGAIMAAGNARPLQDLLYDQYKFLYKLDGDFSETEKRHLEQLKIQINNLEKLKTIDSSDADFSLPLGISPYYWKSMITYNPTETIQQVDEPIFLIQGKGDYQVTMKDYKLFRRALDKRKLPYKAKSYAKVNHLLYENVGNPSNKEYERSVNVEQYIVDDIAEWILNQMNKK